MDRSRRPGGLGRLYGHSANVGLAVAMGVANVFGYGSVVLVSGVLGPADFGAAAALTGLGVVVSIPGGTLQVLVAARRSQGRSIEGVVWIGMVVGLIVASALVIASPVVTRSFSLASVWPVIWLATAVVPTTMSSVQQGMLLGARRLGALSTLVVLSGVSRVSVSAWLASTDPSVSTVMASWSAAAAVPVLVGLALVGSTRSAHGERWRWLPALVRSSLSFGALITLTNVDVVMARHYLAAYDSGLYGVASMFARVIFWATQFIAMVLVPRLAVSHGRRIVVRAYLAVLAVASPALMVLAVAPDLALRLLGLGGYREAADLLVLFGLLGVLWACIQVSTFVGITRQRHRTTVALWAGVVTQIVVTAAWWHDTTGQVLFASMTGAVVALVIVWAPSVSRQPEIESESVA